MGKVEFQGEVKALPSFWSDFIVEKEETNFLKALFFSFFLWRFSWRGKKEYQNMFTSNFKEGDIVKITIETIKEKEENYELI